MKISLIESYQVQDVRHYELDETKIEADFGSSKNFEEALFTSEWSEDTHFLNLLTKIKKKFHVQAYSLLLVIPPIQRYLSLF